MPENLTNEELPEQPTPQKRPKIANHAALKTLQQVTEGNQIKEIRYDQSKGFHRVLEFLDVTLDQVVNDSQTRRKVNFFYKLQRRSIERGTQGSSFNPEPE